MKQHSGISAATLTVLWCIVAGQFSPNEAPGRTVYVHLFEWKWTDIAAECERFLGPKGFAGVQVSPPNEHRIITDPAYPWYERYQPVSWKLVSRSGNEAEFKDMVKRCNRAGVRIYVDAVFNQMAGSRGIGSAGSSFDSATRNYSGVPFGPEDFTPRSECPTKSGGIDSYNNALEVRNCDLLGMPDLAIYKNKTRETIVKYLNHLIDIGVAGFRIDAAKHMWPQHLYDLLSTLKDLNPSVFAAGTRPFIFEEVIDQGGEPIKDAEYTRNGRVTEFKYGKELSKGIKKEGGQLLKYFRNFGEQWGFLPADRAVTFVDNHDNQRGHGGGGGILTFRNAREYKIANAFMLAHPYGFPQVMSSFTWPQRFADGEDKNNWMGPPSDDKGHTNSVPIRPDNSCDGGWICEHRWRQITNMVGFRNVAGDKHLTHWWDNGANQIAFGRGDKAFIVINNEGLTLKQTLPTGFHTGIYCDVISGDKIGATCSGKRIEVKADGMADFLIGGQDEDPVVAIHVDSRL
ncbi:Alpha-amylase 2B [Hypsibius exemplaris]|uniref:Alpha-amylase n=1 Tax=Hypsibius exemplaris TaxID=2072580 RepID=A0A1W0X4A0_HYPEX|nr:Alpha-amylase 2B [Hypsibius exemplaris]